MRQLLASTHGTGIASAASASPSEPAHPLKRATPGIVTRQPEVPG